MLGNIGADSLDAGAVDGAADARSMALALMSKALGHLDSDSNIPPFIGAHLQSAIDELWASASDNHSSVHLH